MTEPLAAEWLRCARLSAQAALLQLGTAISIEGLTEIRPGTYVFNDRNTVGVGACSWDDCALRVLVTVVSTAVKGRAIVDGGSKTFSGDRWLSGGKTGFGHVVEHPDVDFTSMSEEHGHMDLESSGLCAAR